MKVSASKRVLFLIIFLFVLLLGGVAYYFKDVISNGIKYGRWFTVDKYEELFDYCDWEKEGRDLSIKCNALVKSIYASEENMEDVCYDILVISKIDSSLIDYKICEKPGKIDFINPYKDFEMVVPVKMEISISGNSLNLYNFNNVTLSVLSPDEIETMFKKIEEKEINMKIGIGKKIAGNYDSFSAYKGYCCEVEEGFISTDSIIGFQIFRAKLNSYSIENDNIKMNFTAHLDGSKNEYSLNLHSKGFELKNGDELSSFVNQGNSNVLLLEAFYDIHLSYLSPLFELVRNETLKICVDDYGNLSNFKKSICDNISTLETPKKEESFIYNDFEQIVLQRPNDFEKLESIFVTNINLRETEK